MKMTDQLARYRQTTAHIPHDKPLFYSSFTDPMQARLTREFGLAPDANLREYFGMYDWQWITPRDRYAGVDGEPDFWPYYADMAIKPGSRLDSNGVLHEPGSIHHFTHMVSPLRRAETLDEVRAFPFREVIPGQEEELARQVRQAHAQDRVANGMIGHIFENAWQVRDITRFLMDMAASPELSEEIFERFTLHNLEAARVLARAGVDQLQTGDDVATQQAMMFGAKRWREVLKPRWKRVYDAAKAIKPDIKIWYHSDGNITEIVEDLIEIGVDILNPVQPECIDVFALKKAYGKYLVFDGAIGTQSVMPFGTPRQVKDTVRRLRDELGCDGALILSPTHVLEPDVPTENILAFVEACLE